MSRGRERLTAVLIAAGLTLLGCSTSEELGEASDAAAHVERVPGQDVSRVTLTKEALSALGLRTEPVRATPGAGGLAVPYAAVLYDTVGHTWVYAVTGARSYQRTAITLDHVADGVAYLSEGLATGTQVVTVGAPELIGAEEGVGGE